MVVSDCLFKVCDVDELIDGKDDYGTVAGHSNYSDTSDNEDNSFRNHIR